MKSLQSKLSSGLLLSLIIAFSTLWLLMGINIRYQAEDYIASRLIHDAEMLLSHSNFDTSGKLTINPNAINLIYQQPFSGHYYIITANDQLITSRSLWDQTLTQHKVKKGQQLRSLQQGPQQQPLLLISAAYEKQNNNLIITIAEDLGPINKNIRQFNFWFASIAGSLLFVLVLLQKFILRNSLLPLIKIHKELHSLQKGQLDKLSTNSPSELQPLIGEVNHLLETTQQRLHRSRNALSDLAHAIKKPLTIIKQISNNTDISPATRKILASQTDDIHDVTDKILKRAQLAGQGYSGALFSFSKDLPHLIKTLDMMYPEKQLTFATHIKRDIHCPIDRQDMIELLGNVLDNAYKWATHNVILHVDGNRGLHICIEDDGPGINPNDTKDLTKRGMRLDEKVQGHGFGLAITADIIADYKGSINFTSSTQLGGLHVTIHLLPHALH